MQSRGEDLAAVAGQLAMSLIEPCGVIPVSLCATFDGSKGDLSRGVLSHQKYDALHVLSGLDIIR